MQYEFNYTLEVFDDTAIPGLHAAIKQIPQNATLLNLSALSWYDTENKRIFPEILKALPPNITTLRPGYAIKLPPYASSYSQKSLFHLLPTHVTTLQLMSSTLPDSDPNSNQEQITVLASIPYSVTSVQLSSYISRKSIADFIEITNALPAHITELRLSSSFFFDKPHEEINTFITKLPSNLTSLDLSWNSLDKIATPILSQIFKTIPKNITSLKLDDNFRSEKTPVELATIFKELPPTITTLDLSWNLHNENGNHAHLISIFEVLPENLKTLILKNASLQFNNETQLNKIFQALPRGITSLDLSENKLFKDKTITEMVGAIKALPPQLTSLYLNKNELNALTTAELGLILSNLPDSITSLYLEENELHSKNGADLAVILGSLGSQVTSLYLGKNELYKKTAVELGRAFRGLARGVTSLHLDHNNLTQQRTELAHAFEEIPTRVTSLNLSHNNFHEMPYRELVIALKALHKNLNSLNLSHNQLHKKPPTELSAIFKALPAELTSLDLSHNGFYLQTAAELTQVFAALPESIKTLTLSVEDIAMRSEEELEALGKALPHVMKVQICDPLGNLVSHASLDTLKLHIGGWIRESNAQTQQLLDPVPTVVCDIISKLATNTNVLERKSFIDEQDRERKCQKFNTHLKIIYLKAIELQQRRFNKESCELHALHTRLRTLKDQYCQGRITDIEFKNQALPKIKEARPTLETHRGGKELYMNFLWFILGLGIGYIAFCAYKGSFFKYNTDSADKLNDLEKNLNTGIFHHAL